MFQLIYPVRFSLDLMKGCKHPDQITQTKKPGYRSNWTPIIVGSCRFGYNLRRGRTSCVETSNNKVNRLMSPQARAAPAHQGSGGETIHCLTT